MFIVNRPFTGSENQKFIPGELPIGVETWRNKDKLLSSRMRYISPYDGPVFTCTCGRRFSKAELVCHQLADGNGGRQANDADNAPAVELTAEQEAEIRRLTTEENLKPGQIAAKFAELGIDLTALRVGQILKKTA